MIEKSAKEKITKDQLDKLIKTYWANQEKGLSVWPGKMFDVEVIKQGLMELENFIMLYDWEILESHRRILSRWARANSSIKNLVVNWGGLDFPDDFIVTFTMTVVQPAQKQTVATQNLDKKGPLVRNGRSG